MRGEGPTIQVVFDFTRRLGKLAPKMVRWGED